MASAPITINPAEGFKFCTTRGITAAVWCSKAKSAQHTADVGSTKRPLAASFTLAESGFSLAQPNQGHLQLALVGKGHLQHKFTRQLTERGLANRAHTQTPTSKVIPKRTVNETQFL